MFQREKVSDIIKKYLGLIDQKYFEAKKARISRFSVEWGIWSREMNLETQKLITSKHPKSLELKYVFIYWVNRSQLLELHYKSKILKSGLKKKLEKECADLKKNILTGGLSDITKEDMQQRVVKGVI